MKDPYAFADPRIAKNAATDGSDEEKLLIKAGVGLSQIAWRRQEIKGRYRGKVELFEMENPTDPDSCFLSAEIPAFSPEERTWSAQTVTSQFINGSFRTSGPRGSGQVHPRRTEHGDSRLVARVRRAAKELRILHWS